MCVLSTKAQQLQCSRQHFLMPVRGLVLLLQVD
jgi:hypothetical protein